ncbi:hypothetical protein FJZ31_19865 [Candidatus Poribacteria bacterium]|nr:hypothetical protein [Candidatus Poribacteria bacterium]
MRAKNRRQKVVKIEYDVNTDILYVRMEGYEKSISTWDEERVKGLIVGRDTKNDGIVGLVIEGFSSYKLTILQDLSRGTYPERVYYDIPEAHLRDLLLKDVLELAYQKWLAKSSLSDNRSWVERSEM